jgi:hypothetical protein
MNKGPAQKLTKTKVKEGRIENLRMRLEVAIDNLKSFDQSVEGRDKTPIEVRRRYALQKTVRSIQEQIKEWENL